MTDRDLLRHALATLAYRASNALHDAPASFARFDGGGKTPVVILAHMGDLLDWALSMAQGAEQWHNAKPLPWKKESARFFAALKRLDDYLASPKLLQAEVDRLLQGPVADALTHTGQIAMLRRMAGAPAKSGNYYAADIVMGRVGAKQALFKR